MINSIIWEVPKRIMNPHLGEIRSSGAPNIAELGAQIVLAFRGYGDDNSIYLTAAGPHQTKEVTWNMPQKAVAPDGIDFKMKKNSSPCLTTGNGRLFMVFNEFNGSGMTYAYYNAFRPVNNWSPIQRTSFNTQYDYWFSTTNLSAGGVFVAWVGTDDGATTAIFYSILNTSQVMASWSPKKKALPLLNAYTSPSVISMGNMIFVVWTLQQNIHYATYDVLNDKWTEAKIAKSNVAAFETNNITPDIVYWNNRIVMVWPNRNAKMVCSSYDLTTDKWEPATLISVKNPEDSNNFQTQTTPTLIIVDNALFMVWNKDGYLWYASAK